MPHPCLPHPYLTTCSAAAIATRPSANAPRCNASTVSERGFGIPTPTSSAQPCGLAVKQLNNRTRPCRHTRTNYFFGIFFACGVWIVRPCKSSATPP